MRERKTLGQSLRGILSALACASLPMIAGAQTLAELKVQAEAGNAAAQITMGERHYYGEGGAPKDNAEALRWFLMAAEQGDADAQGRAGSLYTGMKGVPRDMEKAKFWHLRAIAGGSTGAAANLGRMYEVGEGLEPDLREALKLYNIVLDRTRSDPEAYEEDIEYAEDDVARVSQLIAEGATVGFAGRVPGLPPEALLPGEVLLETTNGCHFIYRPPQAITAEERAELVGKKHDLPVPCRNGLAHGPHVIGSFTTQYKYGRSGLGYVHRIPTGARNMSTYFYAKDGSSVTITNAEPDNLLSPVWSQGSGDSFVQASAIGYFKNGDGFNIATNQWSCSPKDKRSMTAEQKRAISGLYCTSSGGDQLYKVTTTRTTASKVTSTSEVFCPNPSTSSGCQSVWQQAVSPNLSLIQPVIAEALANEKAEQEIIRKFEAYEAELAAWEKAKKDAVADLARRRQAEKDNAVRLAAEQAAELARLEAVAREEAQQKEFADSLKTLNPGQMLARADELEQEGRAEDARTVRRELLSRFPDHPLAVVAAEKLTAAPKPPAGPEAEFAALRKRAEKGEVSARMEIASAYYSGKGTGQDRAEAARWYRAAADQGNADAQNYLGNMLYAGDGVPKDAAEAALYYRLAADQGHAAAQNNLGNAYFVGNGVEKNRAEAAHWYETAAKQGHARAQNSLAILYWNGDGITQNAQEAARWFQAAAEQGIAEAQNLLGVMLYDGTDIPRDYARAARYFRLAADQGLASAQNNLGNAYRYGNGVNKDAAAAAAWFQAASKQGHELAGENLAALEKQLANEAYQQRLAQQQAEAQRAQAQRAEEQRQRQQEADSKAWGMLAAGGLAAALGGNTEDVLGAMTGQPVVRQQSSSGSSSSGRNCSGQNRTASCLMEQCKDQMASFRRTHPSRNLECRPSTGRDGDQCVAFIDHENAGNYSIACTSGFGAAR